MNLDEATRKLEASPMQLRLNDIIGYDAAVVDDMLKATTMDEESPRARRKTSEKHALTPLRRRSLKQVVMKTSSKVRTGQVAGLFHLGFVPAEVICIIMFIEQLPWPRPGTH